MIRSLLTISVISAATLCSAQVVEEPKPGIIYVQDVTITSGFGFGRSAMLQMSEFEKLMPSSMLLQEDMSGFQAAFFSYLETKGNFGVLVGMQLRDKSGIAYRRNPILRAGFQYGSGVYFSAGKYKESTTVIDTLISQQTGHMYFVDSINTRSYSASYSSQQIRLDVSLLYGTNSESRWSLYGGLGLTAGMSLQAKTEISYGEYSAQRVSVGLGYSNVRYSNQRQIDYRTELVSNKSNLAFCGYVPLGVDFRIGKKRPFWKQVHLIYELRPALTVTNIPELGVYPEAQLLQQFGLKVRW